MERYAGRRGVGHLIRWHGKVPRTEVFELLRRSHLHIISSLSEGILLQYGRLCLVAYLRCRWIIAGCTM